MSYDFDDHVLAHWDEWAAVEKLLEAIRVVLPLAAAAQAGRCWCGRAIPWERTGWASPHCYTCMVEDEVDVWRRTKLEAEALGKPAPVAPWEREGRHPRRGP